MDQQELAKFEQICQLALNPQDPKSKEAREMLNKLCTETSYIDKLKLILEVTNVTSAQYFAALCIKNILTSNWNKIDTKVKVEFKAYLMNYLATKAPALGMDTLKVVIQCLVLLVKLGWFDDPSFKSIVTELQTFSTFSYSHQLIAFVAFDFLIQEMGSYNKTRSPIQNLNVTADFQDLTLGEILTFSLKAVGTVMSQLGMTPAERQGPTMDLLLHALKATRSCMTFDFADCHDDSTEDLPFSQMPSDWSSVLLNEALMQPIFDVVFNTRSEAHQIAALKVVCELCGCCFIFFRNDDKQKHYCSWLLPRLMHAMETFVKVPVVYRECLVAFAKYTGNFGLSDLEKTGLTQNLIIMWDFFARGGLKKKNGFINNSEILLVAWTQLFKRTMYWVAEDVRGKLTDAVKGFLDKFIEKCLKLVGDRYDGCEGFAVSELKGSGNVFDLLAEISLYCYEIVIDQVHSKTQACMEVYRLEVQKKSTLLGKLEDRLGWLIQLVASMLKAKAASKKGSSTPGQKEAEIYAGILKLMNFTTSLYRQGHLASTNLEFAYLAFCDGFWKDVIANPKRLICSADSEFETSSDTYFTMLEKALEVTSFSQVVDMLLQKM